MKKMLKTWTKAALLAVMATFLLAGFPACSDSDDDPEPVMHTVTFVSDGSPVAPQTVEHGKKATKPTTPTKDGYTFSGWYTGGTEFDFNTPITGDITLTAQWEQVPYKVYKTENGAKLTIYEDGTFEYTDADGNSSKGTYKTVDNETITGTFTDGPLADSDSEFKATIVDGSISATVNGEKLEFSPEDDDPGSSGQTPTPTPGEDDDDPDNGGQTPTPTPGEDDDDPDNGGQTPTPTPGDEDDDDTTIPVTSISLKEKNVTVMVNETVTLVATVSPDNATNQAMTWQSDNEEVATVDEDGTVTGMSRGKANITVTTADGNHTDSCEVTVSTPAPTSDYLEIEATDDGGWEVTGCLSSKFPNDGKVEIPAGVTTIGRSAFYYCSALESVEIPDSVTTIGEYAFELCKYLESVTIGAGVTTIGEYAFQSCTKLASVTIGAGVTTIGEKAFYGCTELASVEIPDSVTTIGKQAFAGGGLASVTIDAGVTTIGEQAFYGCTKLASVEIPDSVTTIGEQAFYSCTKLASVTIGAGVTTIGGEAFAGCGLASVTIGAGVTTIGEYAFQSCTKLASVTIGAGVTTIGERAFGSCGLASVEIPDSVTTIGESAFYDCTKLESVTIGAGVTTIGKSAFRSCTSLASVTIPDGVTEIGGYAFAGCASLASVTIPDGVTTIGSSAFAGCASFTSMTIPSSVTTIGSSAFAGCSNLTEVTFAATDGWCEDINGAKVNVEKPVTNAVNLKDTSTSRQTDNWGLRGLRRETE